MIYLEIVRQVLGQFSGYEIAKNTGLKPQMINRYQNGQSEIENMTLKVANAIMEFANSRKEDIKMKRLVVINLDDIRDSQGVYTLNQLEFNRWETSKDAKLEAWADEEAGIHRYEMLLEIDLSDMISNEYDPDNKRDVEKYILENYDLNDYIKSSEGEW
jgi:hypothetical protein|nr:MAG TPA: DNA-binding protein [Caudoviricetes sp.]